MNSYYYKKLIVAVLVFISFCIIALKNKNKLSHAIKWMTSGVFLAIFILICLPENSESLLRFFLTLQTGTLDADYALILDNAPNFSIYTFFLKFFCILAPLAFGGFIVSFFEPFLDKLIFFLIRKNKNVYIFNDFTEQIFDFAKDIRKNDNKALVIFLNISREDTVYIKIKDENFLIVNSSYKRLTFKTKKRCYYFFLSEPEENNISNSLEVLNTIHNKRFTIKDANYKIFIQLQSNASEIIFDSLEKGLIEVKIFNYFSEIVQNFFVNYPLFNYITKESNKLLIVGNNEFAYKMLKAALCYGNLSIEYQTNITVIVDNIIGFQNLCTNEEVDSFLKEYGVNVLETDFSIKHIINYLKDASKTSSIIICTLNSSNNLNIANKIREFYLRKDLTVQTYPEIFIYNNSNTISSFLNDNKDSYKGITVFGSDNCIYSYKNLIDNSIDKIALNIQSVYEKDTSSTKNAIIQNYYKYETNKRSCKNNAVHLFYKLHILGFKIVDLQNKSDENNIKLLIDTLNDEKQIKVLGELEHLRWMTFERTEGWKKASIEEAVLFSKFTKSHKYSMAKLHACLCSWDELKQLQNIFGIDFQELDIRFLKNIPQIFGLVDDKQINITNLKYGLKRI